MRHKLVWMVFGASLLGTGQVHVGAQDTDQSAWQLDLEKAKAAARRFGKPIFLVFR